MYVSNMISNSGNKVPNQFVITEGDISTFQSYESTIATIDEGPQSRAVTLDPKFFEYSNTTMRYLARFLGHGIAETRSRIKRGEYKLASLNK
mgnify:CR=1 FL=1|tara:strand:- start:557 stop:832 length:276 start_codon:yes stop_codon:yes gene_type:complete